MRCEFCDEKEFVGRTVFEDDSTRAFLTKTPIVPGHILIIPKRHAETFSDLSDSEKSSLFTTAQKIAEALKRSFNAVGFHYAWNEGVVAGPTVSHKHFHVGTREKGGAGFFCY